MTLGLAFWILMLLWLVLGVIWPRWPINAGAPGLWPLGGDLLLFVLLMLLGWHSFGPPLHG
jgi:hypothetical protein